MSYEAQVIVDYILSDLCLVLAEVWQVERRLRVNKMMVDVSLGGHEHQTTANAAQMRTACLNTAGLRSTVVFNADSDPQSPCSWLVSNASDSS